VVTLGRYLYYRGSRIRLDLRFRAVSRMEPGVFDVEPGCSSGLWDPNRVPSSEGVIMSLLLDGIGAVIKKVTEWVPSKSESLRKRRKEFKDEIDKIMRQPMSTRDNARLHDIAYKLSKVEEELANIAK